MANDEIDFDFATEPTEGPFKEPVAWVQEAVEYYRQRERKAKRNWKPPTFIPPDDRGIAQWWLHVMSEPFNPKTETPRLVPIVGKSNKTGFHHPYVHRVMTRLWLFLDMPEHKQRMVIAAKEDGIWWRGETDDVMVDGEKLWQFTLVIREFDKQREMGVEEYRKHTVGQMKRMGGAFERLAEELEEEAEEWNPA